VTFTNDIVEVPWARDAIFGRSINVNGRVCVLFRAFQTDRRLAGADGAADLDMVLNASKRYIPKAI
jgi:CO dehydrogenase/acetyl-CoA synthase epsilon subunit